MATSYSLLEFHDIPSNCTSNSTSDGLDGDLDDEDDLWSSIRTPDGKEDKVDESVTSPTDVEPATTSDDDAKLSAGGKSNAVDGTQTKKKSPGKHPYIVNRSHIFVIKESRLLDRKAFDKKHKGLLQTSCGRLINNIAPTWMMCNRDYNANGNWETRMSLLPEREGGRKELAYGPYVGRLKHGAGPKDVVKIPVSKEVCDGKAPDRSLDPKTIHVKHHIKFSTLSPGRLGVLESFLQSDRPEHNATEAKIIHAHDAWRQNAGFFGDRQEGSHPWRRFTLSLIDALFVSLPVLVLSILYWYTRRSTTGLSHTGAMLVGMHWLLRSGSHIVWNYATQGYGEAFLSLIFDGIEAVPGILMLQLIWPVEWADGAAASKKGRWKRWFSSWSKGLRRTRWTHAERRNLRIEANIPGYQIAALFAGCYIIIYLPWRFDLNVIAPVAALPFPEHERRWYTTNAWIAVFEALKMTGTILQIYHNTQTRTFAGAYALAAQLMAVKVFLDSLWHIPSLIGTYDAHPGLQVHDLINLGLVLAMAWQSRQYPRVEQDVKNEEEEEVDE